MAEIKDVYSLEFNSGQFQSEIDSAIARIEELNGAMAQGADVADELAAAQGSLVDVLGTEAKGVEQLNQKRNVLVNTQKQVNAESKTGVAVTKQLDTTNKQLAVSTGQAAKQQRGLGQTLIAGTREISKMRRVVSQLGFAFRLIGSVLPFGLILSFAGPIIGFFQNLVGASDQSAKNMEKLSDSTLPLAERLDIATQEIEKLNSIEAKRGSLTDEEQKKRRELVDTYKQTSEQIIKEEEDRFFKLRGMQIDAERIRIKLQGESVEQIKKAAELERVAIDLANKKQRDDAYKRYNDALGERDRLLALNLGQQAQEQEIIAKKAGEELDAIGQLQNQQLAQNEADKNKAIADFNKKAEDDAKRKRLDSANKAIEDEENRLKLIILKTEEGSLKRVNAEADMIIQIENLRKKFAKELELDETELAIMQEENLDKRKKLFDEYYKSLEEKAEKKKDVIIGPTREDLIQKLKELNDFLKVESDIIENNNEANLAKQLAALETERNNDLIFAAQTITDQEELAKAFESIDEKYNDARKDIEKKSNIQILNDRIKLLESLKLIAANSGDKATEAELNKQIEQAKLQVIELNKISTDGAKQNADIAKGNKKQKEEDDKEMLDKQKELIDQTTNLIQGVSDNVFNVLNAQVQAYIDGLDRAIDKSKSALNEIRANSENYNAQQLEIEKERLEKLENERAKAVERERILGQIQVGINAAIAISRAATEPGAPFVIALTLASLIAGLAQARVAAGNAFFEGSEYVNRGNNKAGRDTIPAMLNEGERVITTDTNNKYWDVLSAVHKNRIPADVLNSFANAYQSGGLKAALGAFGENVSLSSELGNKSIFVNVAQTYQGMENRLERIEAVLTDLPKYMPRTVVSANANGIFKIVEQRQRRKNYSSNWSK
jgi:hypothetical protein